MAAPGRGVDGRRRGLRRGAGPVRVSGPVCAGPRDQASVGAPPRRAVLAWWALAVIVRSGYVPLAFGSRRLWAATADSALLCVVMARYASLGRRVDQTAAALAVPEIAWTAFATVLSAAVAGKNS